MYCYQNEIIKNNNTRAVQYSDAPTFLRTGVVGKLSGTRTSNGAEVSGGADALKPLPECARYGRRVADGEGQPDQDCGEVLCRELLPIMGPIHF